MELGLELKSDLAKGLEHKHNCLELGIWKKAKLAEGLGHDHKDLSKVNNLGIVKDLGVDKGQAKDKDLGKGVQCSILEGPP